MRALYVLKSDGNFEIVVNKCVFLEVVYKLYIEFREGIEGTQECLLCIV